MSERPLLLRDVENVGPPSETARQWLPADFSPVGSMRAIASTVCMLFGADPPAQAEEPALPEVLEHLEGSDKLAHIVIDAFGVATWHCHQRVTHVFNRLAQVRQVELQSVLPAVTPVNFATIASGASPETHQVTKRDDPLRVDTMFARLKQVGVSTAVCGRALSTTGVLLSGLSDVPSVAESNTDKEVLDLFLDRVREGTHYILAQFLDVDSAGHADGPWGMKSHQAVGRTDFRIRSALREAAEHGYALLIHADHGQHEVEPEDVHANSDHRGTHSGRRQEDVRVPLIYLTNSELRQVMQGIQT